MWITYIHIVLVIWNSCCTSVTGSSQVVLAKVGDDVILPCDIKPPVNVAEGTVQWSRPDLTPDYVHLLQDGHVKSDVLNPLYKQRTSLFVELPRGNISLKLSRVQLEDNGTFKCFFPTLDSSTLVQLVETVPDTLGAGAIAGAIAGIVIAENIILVAAVLGCVYWRKKKTGVKDENDTGVKEENDREMNSINQNAVSSEMKVLIDDSSTQPPASSVDQGNVNGTDDQGNVNAVDGPDQNNIVPPKEDKQYELSSKPTGLCVIIRNDTVEGMEHREHSKKDAAYLARTFSRLGFRVLMYEQHTQSQIRKTLECFSKMNLTELQEFTVQEWSRKDCDFIDLNVEEDLQHGDAFVCCIISHGAVGCVYGTDGKAVYIDDITMIFNCPALVDKPKVFFVDARGREGDMTPMKEDFLFAMPAIGHNPVNKNSITGSFFQQTVSERMETACYSGDDLLTILDEVKNALDLRCQQVMPGQMKQIPAVKHNLTKRLVFRPISN